MNTLLSIAALGVIAMLTEVFRIRKSIHGFVLLALAGVFTLNAMDWNTGHEYYHRMFVFDNFAVAFSGLLVAISFIWVLMSGSFFRPAQVSSEHFALVSFALAGGVVMTGFGNLTMLFIGIEIISIAAYILAGSDKKDQKSNESALKYFMLGAFATGFLLFGIALLYGSVASFDIRRIGDWVLQNKDALPASFYAGVVLVMAGLLFKVAAVPFHFWAPDVYDGAPSPVTAFMATIIKTAAFAAFYRLFVTCFAAIHEWWAPLLAAISAVTMLSGNILAVYQSGLKRLLAYSSIAHAGYMLMAVVALGLSSPGALLYYATAYSIATLGIFALIYRMKGNEHIHELNGYFRSQPVNAVLISVLVLSMAGIPPVAGFFAKYVVFLSAFKGGFQWLVGVAILSSLVGVFYYFRIIIAMFKPAGLTSSAVMRGPLLSLILALTAALSLVLGLLPHLVLNLL